MQHPRADRWAQLARCNGDAFDSCQSGNSATVNVRGDGIVVIEEIADRRPPRTPSASWWFQLSPGDVWCMPGDKEHGYVRWNCYHGLPHDEIKEECQPGCTKCRISLNLRYGYARSP